MKGLMSLLGYDARLNHWHADPQIPIAVLGLS
jgi:hypothetical protein